jgi:hypothetical protein
MRLSRLSRLSMWRYLGIVSVVVTLAGCSIASGAATATTTPSPHLATATATGACGVAPATASVGGITVAAQAPLDGLAYPTAKLPDGIARQPLVVAMGDLPPLGTTQPKYTPDLTHPTNPLVMQDTGGGYVLSLQNSSAAAHTVRGVDVCLDSLTPASGQLNEWQPCDAPYSRSGPSGPGGCGGLTQQDVFLHAPFTATPTVGTRVSATQTRADNSFYTTHYQPFPITLQPGERLTIEIGIGPTTTCPVAADTGFPTSGCLFKTPGTYTFVFGVLVDAGAPVFTAQSPPTLLSPASEWTGQACATPGMQAQIPPATTPSTNYVCPV